MKTATKQKQTKQSKSKAGTAKPAGTVARASESVKSVPDVYFKDVAPVPVALKKVPPEYDDDKKIYEFLDKRLAVYDKFSKKLEKKANNTCLFDSEKCVYLCFFKLLKMACDIVPFLVGAGYYGYEENVYSKVLALDASGAILAMEKYIDIFEKIILEELDVNLVLSDKDRENNALWRIIFLRGQLNVLKDLFERFEIHGIGIA